MTSTRAEVRNDVSGKTGAEESLLLAVLIGNVIAMPRMVDARQQILESHTYLSKKTKKKRNAHLVLVRHQSFHTLYEAVAGGEV